MRRLRVPKDALRAAVVTSTTFVAPILVRGRARRKKSCPSTTSAALLGVPR